MSYSDRTFPQGLYVTFWGEGTEPELSLVSKIDFFPRRLRNLGRGGCRCVDEQSDTMAPVTAKAELVCRCFSTATAAVATAAGITGGGVILVSTRLWMSGVDTLYFVLTETECGTMRPSHRQMPNLRR